MCTRRQLTRLVRCGIREFRLPSFNQTRHMARRPASSQLTYKAVFDAQGDTFDDSRLRKLEETIQQNEMQSTPQKHKMKTKGQDSVVFTSPTKKSTKNEEENLSKKKKKKEMYQDFVTTEVKDSDVDEEDLNFLEQKKEERTFHIPHYTKIYGWDKSNSDVKKLGKILHKNNKNTEDLVILEGSRLINDALSAGLQPSVFIFSRVKLLKDIPTEKIESSCEFYHVPYNNIKMWSDLSTPTGVMAVFSKSQVTINAKPHDSLPLILVCDNIRTPDNLGSVLRVAACAGVNRVFLTPGCVSPWNRKVLRAAAGAHFTVPIEEKIGWKEMTNLLPSYPQVVLCDLLRDGEQQQISQEDRHDRLEQLENRLRQEGVRHHTSEENPDSSVDVEKSDTLALYREIPVTSSPVHSFSLNPGIKEVVVVIGGETEGVSDSAYKFCHDLNGSRLHIPLKNGMNSLNVASASSVVLYSIQQKLLPDSS